MAPEPMICALDKKRRKCKLKTRGREVMLIFRKSVDIFKFGYES